MFRNLALAAVAALTLGVGVASTAAPAAAQGVGIYVDTGRHGGHYNRHHGRHYGRHYAPPRRHCERVVIRKRVHGHWRKIVTRDCSGRRYGHYRSY
jgi:hypothetical protein